MQNIKTKNRKILGFAACLLIAALILSAIGINMVKATDNYDVSTGIFLNYAEPDGKVVYTFTDSNDVWVNITFTNMVPTSESSQLNIIANWTGDSGDMWFEAISLTNVGGDWVIVQGMPILTTVSLSDFKVCMFFGQATNSSNVDFYVNDVYYATAQASDIDANLVWTNVSIFDYRYDTDPFTAGNVAVTSPSSPAPSPTATPPQGGGGGWVTTQTPAPPKMPTTPLFGNLAQGEIDLLIFAGVVVVVVYLASRGKKK